MKTVSLELSKQLYELGVRVESEFIWHKSAVDEKWMVSQISQLDDGWFDGKEEIYVAPTSDELGELLPAIFHCGKTLFDEKDNQYNCFVSFVPDNTMKLVKHNERADTMADCMAKMLISLHKEGLQGVKYVK